MAEDTRVGTELGGYRIERLIGRGGMSAVYLAHHARLERRVALKLLAPELAESERFRDRFLRESKLAASIDHPNIVPIYDADEADGTLFIAMRYVEGSDLKQLIRSEGRLDADRSAAIVGQVASALDAAHALGLVHRDIKPSNVLLTTEDHVYVSDFGLTKRALSVSGLTATGQLVGTIDYVAPEHIKGDAVDRRADVYSLGCMVYECLSGHPPYPRDLEVGVLWAHVEEPPPKVTDERPELPVEVDEVVASAMAKDPDERTPAAGEVATGLRSALRLEPPTGEVTTRPRARPARKTRRGRVLVVAGIALVALIAVGAVLLIASGGGGGVVPRANSIGRIDAGTGAFTTAVGVGVDPTGVAVGEDGDVWVINQGDSTVSRIDPDSSEVTSTKSTLGIPSGVAAGEGAVWITNGYGGPSGSGEVVRVDLTDESVESAFPSGNAKAIVVAFGSIWLADADRDLVLRYDPKNLDAAPVEIPTDEDSNASAAPRSLSVGTGSVEGIWVANELGDTVLRIDPETNEVADRIPVESPYAVAADGGGVWVTSELNDKVHLFEPADGRPVRTFDTADGVLDGPTEIVIAPSGIWFGSDFEKAVARLDPDTNLIDRVEIDGITGGIAVDAGGDVWVAVRAQAV